MTLKDTASLLENRKFPKAGLTEGLLIPLLHFSWPSSNSNHELLEGRRPLICQLTDDKLLTSTLKHIYLLF
jgi:hypothetical protein